MLFSTPLTLLTTALWLSSLTPIANAGWINDLRPRASGASSCVTCPPQDAAGFPVGTQSDSGGVIFCSYPAFPGENPNDFFCRYNDSTGAQVQDNDVGFCPSTATQNCPTKRGLTTKRERVAAQPQPAAIPNSIRSIKSLRKNRDKLAIRKAHEDEILAEAAEEETA
ncbi:hypothetical protein FRB97_005173 [Tulasnella sp. 331]|nr:hypothetical protein FRB97_005173 [Tulasnella sp. 331]KAG8871421.1 hypothetical protein FRB98_000780 [Tulasnella sp. 332]